MTSQPGDRHTRTSDGFERLWELMVVHVYISAVSRPEQADLEPFADPSFVVYSLYPVDSLCFSSHESYQASSAFLQTLSAC